MPHVPDPRLQKALDRLMRRPTAITLSDMRQPDAPLVYANSAFEELTGYRAGEILGLNCRFLQGPGTDREAVERIRVSVETGTDSACCVLNYRKDGTAFHNLLMLAPVPCGGEVSYMLGCQYPIRKGVLGAQVDAQVTRVQGVIGEVRGAVQLPAAIWSSLRTRTEAIRLVVDAYLLSLEQGE